jgi:hypothetical protein
MSETKIPLSILPLSMCLKCPKLTHSESHVLRCVVLSEPCGEEQLVQAVVSHLVDSRKCRRCLILLEQICDAAAMKRGEVR